MKLRIMSTSEAISNLKKKFWIRSSVFSLFLIAGALTDEYIKEGYFFKPSDVTKVGTHESIIVTLIVYSLLALSMHKKSINKTQESG